MHGYDVMRGFNWCETQALHVGNMASELVSSVFHEGWAGRAGGRAGGLPTGARHTNAGATKLQAPQPARALHKAVALARVALEAQRLEVAHVARAALGHWDDVVHHELGPVGLGAPTDLAAVAVALKYLEAH